MILLLRQQAPTVFDETQWWTIFIAVFSMSAGTVFIMWLGELISEKHVGNGVSIMIFAGIAAGLPQFLQRSLAVYDRSQLITLILFILVVIVTIVGVVIMHEAQRNIPVQYTRGGRVSRFGAVANHLPLKVNMAGVIPIIFAISIILFPRVFAQFFTAAKSEWLRQAATFTMSMFDNQIIYGVVYFVLVFFFSYFYTAVIFHPDRVAENLQNQGGFIPGIRPGKPTAEYLNFVSNRILLAGALFLSVIAVMPVVLQGFTGNASLVIGGTSVLIVVNVVIETVKKIEAQLTMREYDLSP
jgi:preprotein translocase subunit SecY